MGYLIKLDFSKSEKGLKRPRLRVSMLDFELLEDALFLFTYKILQQVLRPLISPLYSIYAGICMYTVLVFRDLLWGPKLRVESLYLAFHPVSSPYPLLLVFINI